MAQIVLIIGLPGSGKTYLAQQEYVPNGYILIDDPSVRPEFCTSENYVICDPWLCNRSLREQVIEDLASKGFDVKTIYFENEPSKCTKNILYRDDARLVKYLPAFQYELPADAKTRAIWQKED